MDAGWESAKKAYEAQIARAEAWNQQLQKEISDLKSYIEHRRSRDAKFIERHHALQRQVGLMNTVALVLAVILAVVLIYPYIAALVAPYVEPYSLK
jgi:Flp pilus assembly protein TadB